MSMHIYEHEHMLVVSLPRNAEIIPSLIEVLRKKNMPSASIWGIGAVHDIVLGYYDLDTKTYTRIPLPGGWELVSCHGTVSTKDEDFIAHLHVVVSNIKGETRGGHLFEGKIHAAGEFVILPGSIPMKRNYNENIGLPLL